ncbi:Deaminated glutathione amidase [Seminavis robusta]|uniref:Deaminated glutathione amidase n=1 Tax=Seminavis robusta TaxID=568900 RepID=A0A9N8DBX8_9STRA|nr:Deaminated glutathione amidase [Seminavis robusta]|eukprot:Sro74_g040750.1 Deaminated glutathione amidase (315) ;mRNA; f:54587-55531
MAASSDSTEQDSSCLIICALQPSLRLDAQPPADAIDAAIAIMEQASKLHASSIDLFVLPELSPIGYSEHTFAHYLPANSEKQQLYLDLDTRMAQAAQDLKAHICYGSVGWHSKNKEDDGSGDNQVDYTIRQIVVDPNGNKVAVYDKIYLCDVGECAETRFFVPSPSEQPVSFQIGNRWNLGMLICFDQRFPTLARTYAAQHNVHVLLQPAAFLRDCTFVTWKSFRETRAIENSVYFVGVNYGGTDYGETTCVPPWVDDSGNEDYQPQSLGRESDTWLVCQIKASVLDQVRTTFPYYRVLKQEASRGDAGGDYSK